MINVSVSKLFNQVDQSEFVLYAEWEDTGFKIIVLRPYTLPLNGEMGRENANYFLQDESESFEKYLEKTKHAFSGKNADIQFFLKDDTFTWKQQNILIRGEITVHPLSNILILSNTLKQSLELYQQCQECALNLKNENEHLIKVNTKLIGDIEEITNIKTTMEKDLYMKFISLLNAKKKKIRELQQALDNTRKTKTMFDKTTDEESESERSDVESRKKLCTKSPETKIYKSNEQETSSKNIRKNLKRFSSSEDTSPEPSTSKNNILQNIDTVSAMKTKQIYSSPSEESEEDMFA
ncbi:hypothetical protein PUN28_000706 [Cardiocondyla obscurior]|uniref:XRCC4 coiled-coil domain-containing protein n=1 Tax=Cardiocondyla obscurior TaxID=286306 RepID=A0AAW2H0N8_9HYME